MADAVHVDEICEQRMVHAVEAGLACPEVCANETLVIVPFCDGMLNTQILWINPRFNGEASASTDIQFRRSFHSDAVIHINKAEALPSFSRNKRRIARWH